MKITTAAAKLETAQSALEAARRAYYAMSATVMAEQAGFDCLGIMHDALKSAQREADWASHLLVMAVAQ